VVLEAMAYGCPLVATRTGGIPEIVEDGVTGLLCQPEASHLAASLRRLLDDPLMAARLGERAGEDAARRYHPETLARERAEFHREIIQRHAAKRR
jgi:alpha-maltose-1-phosphate synthase